MRPICIQKPSSFNKVSKMKPTHPQIGNWREGVSINLHCDNNKSTRFRLNLINRLKKQGYHGELEKSIWWSLRTLNTTHIDNKAQHFTHREIGNNKLSLATPGIIWPRCMSARQHSIPRPTQNPQYLPTPNKILIGNRI